MALSGLLLAGALASGSAQPSPASLLQAELRQETARAREALERFRQASRDLESPDWAGAVQQALDRAAGLRVRLAAEELQGEQVDRVYETVIGEGVLARSELREALEEHAGVDVGTGFATRLDLEALRASTLSGEVAVLERLLADIDRESAALGRAVRRSRWDRVLAWRDVVRRLNELRIDTLDRLTPAYRADVLGLTREGVAQLRREIEHLRLSAEVYALERWQGMLSTGNSVRDVFKLGQTVWTLLKMVIVLAAFTLLWRSGPAYLRWSERTARAPGRSARFRRRLETFTGIARAVAPWLALLVLLNALAWAAGPAAAWPETRLLHRLATLYVLYRLAIDVLVGGSLALVRRYRLEVGAERTVKILRSVRFVLRVVFAIILLLTLSARFLGEGYLYHVVYRLAVIALGLAFLRVFLAWRVDIIDAYLSQDRAGWLRQRVESSRSRWYGPFLAAGALIFLAGRAIVALAQEFALGFDQTRRALAYFFRRRVEKHAERVGYAEPQPEESLPPPLRDALTEDPVTDPQLLVDHFPGMDELDGAIAAWREHGTGGSFLLTGDFGVGRTSWLNRVEVDGLPVERVTFDRRIDSDAILADRLAAGIHVNGAAGSSGELAGKLLHMPRRVVVIDRGQNLFLGRVGGYAGFESFVSLVEDTLESVFWIVAFSRLAWEHIAAVHPHLAGFRHHVALDPWPEERIRDLIRRRVEASGVAVNYDDLLLEALEGLPRRVRDSEIEESYSRLLWDHTLGLPRVALHYWRRSLVPDGEGSVRVRLFRAPRAETLERFGDVPLFLLAAIIVHESLTLNEMAVVTRYPERLCRIHALRLEDAGALGRIGDRYWITSYWLPVVARMLKRRNLLSD